MSLNNIYPTASDSFDLLPEEKVLTGPHDSELEICVPPTLQGPKQKARSKGRLWVTDQRVVFLENNLSVPNPGSSRQPPEYEATLSLRSLAIPYTVLIYSGFELPVFSQNYIAITFLPDPLDPNNNFPQLGRGSDITGTIWVGDGAGHGVWKRIEGERQLAEARRNAGEMLPAYEA
ncbi:hypothetical protein DB88DRAFT_524065 [Papiliotrema laurentii]|uniref:Uncharacterized protein n=1 Tax=Papiliotrema laurentii TaxID=5418 RepID=A0AAD9L701_PAPLA|nr:hypothetical protein DB88DRAFT_524065 [Papiliotrema laurentii]